MDDIELDNIFVYQVKLPCNVREAVVPCVAGYTIYINQNLTYEQRRKAFAHALFHIREHDFDKEDVQQIETRAHKEIK